MAIIDSYSETNVNDYFAIYAPDNTGRGQSFTGDGTLAAYCKFYLCKGGSPTGNAVAKLYNHSGTFGTSSVPTGSALATSGTFNVATLDDYPNGQLITFTFTTSYQTVNGTKYVITIEYSGGDGSNALLIGTDTTSPTHAGNNCSIYDGTNWVANDAFDNIFYVNNTPTYTATSKARIKQLGVTKTTTAKGRIEVEKTKTSVAKGRIDHHKRYWVDNGGNWSDAANHWSYSSGGSPGAPKPTSLDNVYFDAASFDTGSQTVTINETANCKDMDWTGITDNPSLSFSDVDLNIYGSLTLVEGITVALNENILIFAATTSGNTIATAGHTFNGDIEFDGNGGEWILQDDLAITTDDYILLLGGTLNTNGKTVTFGEFKSGNTASTTLNLGASTINVNGTGITVDFDVESIDNLNAGTSEIILNSDGAFITGGKTFHKLTINNVNIIYGSNTFNTIQVNAGKTATFDAGPTQTVTNFIANGTVGQQITLNSKYEDYQFTLSKSSGVITVEQCQIQDSEATGGATWRAKHSVDLGNNTGWLFEYEKTINAKGRINQIQEQSIAAKARIRTIDITQTAEAKGRISVTQTKTCTAKARIKLLNITKEVTAKGNIVSTQTQTKTATSKGRIKILGIVKTVDAKGNILVGILQEQSVLAKASIRVTLSASINAKGRIEIANITQTVAAKASINTTFTRTKTVTAKANIFNTVVRTVTAKARLIPEIRVISLDGIVLPPPSESRILPIFPKSTETLGGKLRMDTVKRKYQYEVRWRFLSSIDYNNLESVVNTLDDINFVYERYPQSQNGVLVKAEVGDRSHTAMAGDDFYSDVSLKLTEVSSRI